jgi:hypothetical protein
MNLTQEQISLMGIFFPYALQKYLEMGNNRLVHYTTAEAAVSMVRTKHSRE